MRLLAVPASSCWVAALLIALAFVVYWPTLDNGFVMDDTYMVRDNEALRDLSAVPGLFVSTPPGPINRGYYRPVMLASFALDRAVFGPGARAFHAVNIVWHGATAWLVFLLLQHFLRSTPESLLGALLFLVHPLQGEVVYLITYRATSISVFFLFAALLYYLRHRASFTPVHALLMGLLFFLSVTAKEMGVVLPFLMLACDLIVPPEQERKLPVLAYATTVLVLGVFATARFLLCEPSSASYFGTSDGARVLRTMVVVEAHVLGLLWVPRGLGATYDSSNVYEPPDFADPVLWLSVAVLGAVLALGYRLRRRAPLIALGIVFYFIALGPTYNILRSPNLFGDRFVYSAMFGFCLCIATALRSAKSTARRLQAFALACVVLIGFSTRTYARALEWRDEESFWRALSAARPQSLQVHVGLATTLRRARKFEEALPHYQAALRLVRGMPHDRALFGEAASCYSHVGNPRGALAVVERWLSLHPDDEGFRQMRRTLLDMLAREQPPRPP